MIRIYSAIMFMSLCISCTHANISDSLSCPTPAQDSPINLWPETLNDKDLLSNSEYITKMIKHGSNANLSVILIKTQYTYETLGAVSDSDLSRVKEAISYREKNNCAEVPSYMPYYSTMPVYPAM